MAAIGTMSGERLNSNPDTLFSWDRVIDPISLASPLALGSPPSYNPAE